MEVGKYTNKKIDFTKFEVKKCPLTLWDKDIYSLAGCGSNLLATVVGKESPYDIRKLNKGKDHTSDEFLIKYLKKHKFTTLKLTQCIVSNRKYFSEFAASIKPYHVLITSQLLKKNECSWFLHHQNLIWHNNEINLMKPFDFLNFPIHTAYLIWHPSYK